MNANKAYIGVDVSKTNLDIYNPKVNKTTTVDNNETGFESIFKMAQELHAIVCCEPTGSYEQGLIRYLQNRHIQIAFCDGLRVRYFAFSRNIYIKNDHVDARSGDLDGGYDFGEVSVGLCSCTGMAYLNRKKVKILLITA